MALTRRERATLTDVARALVPPGGAVPKGADELGLVESLIAEVDGYPRRAHRRTRLLLFACEYFPLLSGRRRRFTHLSPEAQLEFLQAAGRHPRSPLRRLVVSYLKSVVYSAYLSHPDVEAVIGYRYECLLPRDGVSAQPGEQTHH